MMVESKYPVWPGAIRKGPVARKLRLHDVVIFVPEPQLYFAVVAL